LRARDPQILTLEEPRRDEPGEIDMANLAQDAIQQALEVQQRHASTEADASQKHGWREHGKLAFEIAFGVIALVTGVLAWIEYRSSHARELREDATRAYDRADSNYNEFLKLCLDHPELDCYSKESPTKTPLDAKESIQQRVLFTMLVDVFEVAYVNYNNEHYVDVAKEAYCTQWPAWIEAMKKYARKSAFQATWHDVGDEFDTQFQRCIEALLRDGSPGSPGDAAETATKGGPSECMIKTCP
jgi:hypothetical protein